MRVLVALAGLSLAAVSCAPSAPPAAPPAPSASTTAAPPAERCLSIVGWNDLHGQLSADDPVVSTGRVPAGGVVALADEIADLRATSDAVVVLDAGDLFTGPLASTLSEGAPVIEAYRVLGVDAAAVGNHEFDFGPVGYERITAPPGTKDDAGANGPRGALLQRMSEASFPFLAANITMAGGATPPWPNFHASTRIVRGGFTVGVVGYTTRDTPTTTLPPNVGDLDFKASSAERVGRAIRELRAAGSSPVVLLAHASIEGNLPQALQDDAPRTGEIAHLLEHLGADKPDLVIAGHRHAWMIGRVQGVPIVSSDQHGVGFARARFCAAGDGKPALRGIERHAVIWSGAPRTELGARVAAAVAPYEARVKAIAETVVTNVAKECSPKGLNGTALGDQIARATAESITGAATPPPGTAVVGFVNAGGVRAPLPAGTAHYSDLFTVFPFENSVAACGTNGAGLRRFIENAIHKDSSRERFPLGISGAKLSLRRAPDGSLTLTSIQLDGAKKPLEDATPVWLALSDFILYGGDSLLGGVSCAPSVASQTRVREAWKTVLSRERACDGPSPNVHIE